MRNRLIKFMKFALCMGISAGWLLMANPLHAKPPPWAPAHGYRAKYQYYYYPGQQIYFNPQNKEYFYLRAGTWKVGVELPRGIHLGDKVILDMDTPKPYTFHSDIRKQYPAKAPKK